jgi:phage terminase small subunit
MAREKLNEQQRRFCEEYVIDNNGKQAAIRAGYSIKTAEVKGSQLLSLVKVREHIAKIQNKVSLKTEIDATYVRNRLAEIDQLDIIDILEEDGSLKPVKDWPKSWRISISAIEITKLVKIGDDKEGLQAVVGKIKWPDKTRNIELLGKHVDIQAFKENVSIDFVDRAAALEKARQRFADNSDK